MTKIRVTTNENPLLYTDINFHDEAWSPLLPENLPPFNIEEYLRPCKAYKDGLFPGAKKGKDGKQITLVQNFRNLLEFSKVMSDEVVPGYGNLFLTTKYYERRQDGWTSKETRRKEGEIMGYCLNGDIYGTSAKHIIEGDFYRSVYKIVAGRLSAFKKLQEFLREGICLNLIGADEDFLEHLTEILLLSFSA